MSPATLRRYRAERMLRRDFDGLRGRVLAAVRSRLRARGMSLSDADLEGCYSQAWHGLYGAALAGEEIVNPCAWLVLVTFRRAVEEHRARARLQARLAPGGGEADELAARLDDRARLRQLLEGLRGRLDERERTAAALCYLQGMTRAQAAARMGISEGRMRKLMEGRGRGAGVSGKIGALVAEIGEGSFCEAQGSLMRALALGMLDPGGERHTLAVAHASQCPACRRYVACLRGLAAALPPCFAGGRVAALLGRMLGRLPGGRGSGAARLGAASSGAAAGGGAAGGGWLAGAGPLGAKLAVGCLLAIGVGAGCVTLESGHARPNAPRPAVRQAAATRRTAPTGLIQTPVASAAAVSQPPSRQVAPLSASARASREFGPEQAGGGAEGSRGSTPAGSADAAHAASLGRDTVETVEAGGSGGQGDSSAPAGGSDPTAAEREFSP